jgi:hypothetical protein
MDTRHCRRIFGSALAFVTTLCFVLVSGVAGAGFEIRSLSNRADLISGGDALVEIVLPHGTDASSVRVELNKQDITHRFAVRADGRFLGLVDGLRLGKNKLTAKGKQGPVEKLTITNYPIGGPIFSGPQVQPWICETEVSGLGPSLDPQCNAATQVDYLYRSTNPAQVGFLPYDPVNPPNDVRVTTTDEGKTVPFIVRREVGTLNRGIYAFAVLFDPSKPALPWLSPPAWNRKLYYIFLGGAMPQHRQGPVLPGAFDPVSVVLASDEEMQQVELAYGLAPLVALSRGFATASASLNMFAQSTNSVTSAETVMMVKERLIDRLGEVRYTISAGESGGSMQQHLIANAYPGLLDGIQPGQSFPDIWTVNTEVQDCSLLLRYFTTIAPQLWSDVTQQDAVMDNASLDPGTCRLWTSAFLQLDSAWMNPTSASCFAPFPVGPGLPQPWMYDPEANPSGTRCTMQDYQVALYGARSVDGFANRPYDNVGVQYGLRALQDGKITVEQFVDLNEKVGGRDIDWNTTSNRSEADPFALRAAYRAGQVNLGGGMVTVPIIDLRYCTNDEVHACFHTWETRARLTKTNVHADNHVAFLNAPTGISFDVLDRWVAAVKADNSSDLLAVKIVRNKPADAVDTCWINGQKVTDTSVCAAANPYLGDPRIGAGAPLADDVLKCQLMPLRRNNYSVSFMDGQWARLQSAFPSGVCDWTKESAGFTSVVPWLSFEKGPGGQPLGSVPESKADDGNDD